jgi:GTPase involved in cell partitioning and DNA repair
VHALLALRNEVMLYSEEVSKKRWMVVCTKCDGDNLDDTLQKADDVFKLSLSLGCEHVIAVSALHGHGLKKLVGVLSILASEFGENRRTRLGTDAILNRLDRRG